MDSTGCSKKPAIEADIKFYGPTTKNDQNLTDRL